MAKTIWKRNILLCLYMITQVFLQDLVFLIGVNAYLSKVLQFRRDKSFDAQEI